MNDRIPTGLYVHVPFCSAKCPYCDFASTPNLTLIPRWIEAVCRELASARSEFRYLQTIYIGGGTPSLLDESVISRLFEQIRADFTITPDAEISIEANPETVSRDRIRIWRSLGISRISLGVQSLNASDLSFLGRRHSAQDALRAGRLIREAPDLQLSIDLMFGFTGQSPASLFRTLTLALSLQPDHLSCYQLNPAPGTPLMKRIRAGHVRPISEIRERRLFRSTIRFLERRGFLHYEISNFARGTLRICRHNMNYWNHTPYLGVGPSAHSFDGQSRWWNVKSVSDYVHRMSISGHAVEGLETLSTVQLQIEALALGLRTFRGVPLDLILRLDPGMKRTERLINTGLLEIKSDTIRATLDGFCVADRLPVDIMGDYSEDPEHGK